MNFGIAGLSGNDNSISFEYCGITTVLDKLELNKDYYKGSTVAEDIMNRYSNVIAFTGTSDIFIKTNEAGEREYRIIYSDSLIGAARNVNANVASEKVDGVLCIDAKRMDPFICAFEEPNENNTNDVNHQDYTFIIREEGGK